MKKILTYLPGFLLLLLAAGLVWPYFKPGFFTTDDGEWAVIRLAEMVRELKDWQIPPRWSDYLNHGFGYPLFSFTYPLPYYLGAALRLLGLNLVDSVKLLFISSVFLSGLTMYLFI